MSSRVFYPYENFSEKFWLRQFLLLKALKLHVKFHKNPMSRFCENVLTDVLTY